MQIGKRDIEKMIDYHSKGSKPEVLARTVKDLGKAKSRAVIASAMGWTGCSKAFINRCKELGASDAEIAEVERMCDTYELPEPFKSQFATNPKLSEVSQLREWFPKLFKVLRDYKVQNIKLDSRTPDSVELEKDSSNGQCWTVAYTLSFDLNGKHYEWKIANHTNEGGGSFGVSAQSPLNIIQGTQQALANRASEILGDAVEESKAFEARVILNQILSGKPVRQAILENTLKTSKLSETRKFKVGEKFIFTDKYGDTHECTVIKKDLFDEEDYDDYAIGTITFTYPTLGTPHKETVRIFKSEQRNSFGDEYFVSDTSKTKNGVGVASWAFPNRVVNEKSSSWWDSDIDVKSARLLTVDEYKKFSSVADLRINDYWWLGSPDEDSDYEVYYVRPDGSIGTDDSGADYGIRPVIEVADDIKPDESPMYGGHRWIYLTKNLLLCDKPVFHLAFDGQSETNDYSKSDAKVAVDRWFAQVEREL